MLNRRFRRRAQFYRLTVVAFALLSLLLFLRARSPEPVIAVWHGAAGEVAHMQLEEYVRGVVAAEMPSHFHPEALKAQAVAARTYALRRIEGDMRLAERPDAHVSSDYRVHQAWISRDDFLVQWSPQDGAARWSHVAEAVEATRGMVLVFEGALAETLYHSTSGGHTEDAVLYFQTSLPYLVGVPDPYGDHSPVHESVVTMPLEAALTRLAQSGEVDGVSAGTPHEVSDEVSVEVLTRTASGRAAEVLVGGHIVSGRQVREALGLRSSLFDVAIDGDQVTFHVRGSGHGVGLSQYGADGMGRAGYTYDQVLAHYYRGANIERRY